MKLILYSACLALASLSSCAATSGSDSTPGAGNVWTAASAAGISHDVFFTFSDPASADVDGLIAACRGLRALPGVVHLTAGRRDPAQTRDVNEQSFHVALHVEFENQAAYDAYGPHPTHQALVKEFIPAMSSVVVYDALLGQ